MGPAVVVPPGCWPGKLQCLWELTPEGKRNTNKQKIRESFKSNKDPGPVYCWGTEVFLGNTPSCGMSYRQLQCTWFAISGAHSQQKIKSPFFQTRLQPPKPSYCNSYREFTKKYALLSPANYLPTKFQLGKAHFLLLFHQIPWKVEKHLFLWRWSTVIGQSATQGHRDV